MALPNEEVEYKGLPTLYPVERHNKRRRTTQVQRNTARMTTRSTVQPNVFVDDVNLPMRTMDSYNHNHEHDYGQGLTASDQLSTCPDYTGLLIAGFPLHDAHLSLPRNLSPSEHARRQRELTQELAFQQHHPPILPPSQVPDLPPKPYVGDFLTFPKDVSREERAEIERQNNLIAARHQRVDRERNNMAAKKSRQARIEALANTRTLLNDKAAKCAWFRMRVLALGGTTAEWSGVPVAVKAGMVEEIAQRVDAVEVEFAEGKKKDEARRRAERNKAKSAERAGSQGYDADREGDGEGEEYVESSYQVGDVPTELSLSGQDIG